MKTYDINRSLITTIGIYGLTAVAWHFFGNTEELRAADLFLLFTFAGALMQMDLRLHRRDILDAECRTILLRSEKDVIVIEAQGAISEKFAKQIKEHIEAAFPGRKCLVIGDGLTLRVVQEDG